MQTEFLLYGIRSGNSERWQEELLACRGNRTELEEVQKIASRDGFHSFRIATFTQGERPNFVASVKRARND